MSKAYGYNRKLWLLIFNSAMLLAVSLLSLRYLLLAYQPELPDSTKTVLWICTILLLGVTPLLLLLLCDRIFYPKRCVILEDGYIDIPRTFSSVADRVVYSNITVITLIYSKSRFGFVSVVITITAITGKYEITSGFFKNDEEFDNFIEEFLKKLPDSTTIESNISLGADDLHQKSGKDGGQTQG